MYISLYMLKVFIRKLLIPKLFSTQKKSCPLKQKQKLKTTSLINRNSATLARITHEALLKQKTVDQTVK